MNVKQDLPLERRSLSIQVYEHIKKMILSREIRGGMKIPEERIAELFKVSRTPIREALRRLEADGLVKIQPRRFAEVITLKEGDRRHLTTLQIALETLAVRLLAPVITPSECGHLDGIARTCRHMADIEDRAGLYQQDSKFRTELARLTRNGYLHEMIKSLDLKIQLLRSQTLLSPEEVQKGLELQTALIAALEAHDPEKAARLVTKHLEGCANPPKSRT